MLTKPSIQMLAGRVAGLDIVAAVDLSDRQHLGVNATPLLALFQCIFNVEKLSHT